MDDMSCVCNLLRISKEVREKLVKVAKAHSEKTKISIRKVLQKGVSEARKMKGQVSEDDIRLTEKQVCTVQTTVVL